MAPPAVALSSTAADRASAPPVAQDGQTVLVVDDSRAQRSLLASLLRKWGHDVICCSDAVEALRIADDPQIGLIISDWMMPGMTGPEFCRSLRAANRDHYAFVLLLTSNIDSGALAEGLEAGADDFLNKPVHPLELRARLNAGARIVAMQRQVVEKNQLLSAALDEINHLYSALDRDLDEARRLQQSLMQERFRSFGNADVSLWLQASGHVGGDMVGFFPVSDTEIGLFSLDVSGHGVASAMIAARVAGILSDASPHQNIALSTGRDGRMAALPPALAAARLNKMILKELESDRYFTLCLAFLNKCTGLLRFVQAGHPHPMVLRVDGHIEQAGEGGVPIGLLPDVEFTTVELQLQPGDRVLFYSDGLTECPGPDGVTQLEEDGLERMIRDNAAGKGPEFLVGLADDLAAFAGTDGFPDDASALWLEYRAPQ